MFVVLSTHHFHHHTFHEYLRLNSYDLHNCHTQTSPLGHVHFSELQPILQSHRNISRNLGSTGRKSVVLGSSLNSDYLHPHSTASNYFFPFSSFAWKYTLRLWYRVAAEVGGKLYASTAFENFFTFSEYRS